MPEGRSAEAAQLAVTTSALQDLYRGFLQLLPGLILGLLVLGVFYLLSSVVRRAILRATRRSCSWVWR